MNEGFPLRTLQKVTGLNTHSYGMFLMLKGGIQIYCYSNFLTFKVKILNVSLILTEHMFF